MLHPEVQYRLALFLQRYPPREFNRMLRNMTFDYFINHREGVNHRLERQFVVDSIWDLIQFLDIAEQYWETRDVDSIIKAHKRRR
ncbi:MAG TPA: hypothetical protein VK658_21490 [Chryseolinea sp.]|nr:hypothetical protein [Chryseolinea sp.]